ncbi:YrzE family protein [Campylobacter concisus]
MNYQDILKQKENNITRIDEIIKFLRENFDGLDKYNSKYGQLIGLLNKERRLYSNLDKSDPDVFYNELRDIKRQIGFKISEIKYELSKALKEKKSAPKIKEQAIKFSEEKDSRTKETSCEQYIKDINKKTKEISKLASEYFEYYLTNSFEERSVKDYFNALLKFHPLILSGISLVSMICYFVYFGIFIGYFPVLSGSEIIYVGALLFTIVAILSLFIVSIMLLYRWYYIRANNQPSFSNNWLAMILTFPLTLILVKYKRDLLNNENSIFFEELYDIFNNELVFFIFIFLISFCLFSFLLKFYNWLKKMNISVAFIVVIIGCIFLAEYIMKTNGLMQLFLCFLLYICILVLIFLFTELIYKDKNPQLFVLAFAVMLFIVIFNYCSDDIAKKFEITNIEYKYLSIEKSVLGALPEEICKNGKNKNRDFNKTYYDENETGGVIKLYNIKVLSTLGKFYYLETIGYKNENNKETRFELDASKIISKEKQER